MLILCFWVIMMTFYTLVDCYILLVFGIVFFHLLIYDMGLTLAILGLSMSRTVKIVKLYPACKLRINLSRFYEFLQRLELPGLQHYPENQPF